MSDSSPAGDLGIHPIDGGYRCKTTENGLYYIDVVEMIYSWRVVRTPVAMPEVYDRGYCYFGFKEGTTKDIALMLALAAAVTWDGADDTHPVGFDKMVIV